MKFVKWLLIVTTIFMIFNLIKPINDRYCYFVGLVIGNIGGIYWYEYFFKGGKDE